MLLKAIIMEISQYIKQILLTEERVILGGFGAFELKYIAARIDKENKTMTPPNKTIVFNPEYQKDEGLLVKYIARKEKISKDIANEQVSEYVKTIKTKLKSGEKVVFKDLGAFQMAENGSYKFTCLSDENLLIDSFGLSKVTISESLNKPNENTAKIKNKKQRIKKPQRVQKTEKAAKAPKNTPQKKQKSLQTNVKSEKGSEEKSKKKGGWLVLLILFGLIGIFAVAVYFFKPDLWKKGADFSKEKIAYLKNDVFGSDKEKLEVINPPQEKIQEEKERKKQENTANSSVKKAQAQEIDDMDSNDEYDDDFSEEDKDDSEEAVAEEAQAETNVEETTNSATSASGNFYLVVGSVKSKESAEKEKKRLAGKGMNANFVYAPKIERYRIYVGQFETKQAAQSYLNNLQKQQGKIDAWIWKR